jgi:hypothetical protein
VTTAEERDEVRERVRSRYTSAAITVANGGIPACGDSFAGGEATGAGRCGSRRLSNQPRASGAG